MALVFEMISECGVVDLMIWLVVLSSKGKWSYNEPPFSKKKEIVVVFASECTGGEPFFSRVS